MQKHDRQEIKKIRACNTKDSKTTIVNRHRLFLGSSYHTYSIHSSLTHFPVKVKSKMSTTSI